MPFKKSTFLLCLFFFSDVGFSFDDSSYNGNHYNFEFKTESDYSKERIDKALACFDFTCLENIEKQLKKDSYNNLYKDCKEKEKEAKNCCHTGSCKFEDSDKADNRVNYFHSLKPQSQDECNQYLDEFSTDNTNLCKSDSKYCVESCNDSLRDLKNNFLQCFNSEIKEEDIKGLFKKAEEDAKKENLSPEIKKCSEKLSAISKKYKELTLNKKTYLSKESNAKEITVCDKLESKQQDISKRFMNQFRFLNCNQHSQDSPQNPETQGEQESQQRGEQESQQREVRDRASLGGAAALTGGTLLAGSVLNTNSDRARQDDSLDTKIQEENKILDTTKTDKNSKTEKEAAYLAEVKKINDEINEAIKNKYPDSSVSKSRSASGSSLSSNTKTERDVAEKIEEEQGVKTSFIDKVKKMGRYMSFQSKRGLMALNRLMGGKVPFLKDVTLLEEDEFLKICPDLISQKVFQSAEAPQIEPNITLEELKAIADSRYGGYIKLAYEDYLKTEVYNNYDLLMNKPSGVFIEMESIADIEKIDDFVKDNLKISLGLKINEKDFNITCLDSLGNPQTSHREKMDIKNPNCVSFLKDFDEDNKLLKFTPLPTDTEEVLSSKGKHFLKLSSKIQIHGQEMKCPSKLDFSITMHQPRSFDIWFTGITSKTCGYGEIQSDDVEEFANSLEITEAFPKMFPVAKDHQGGSYAKIIKKNNKTDLINGDCTKPNKGSWSWLVIGNPLPEGAFKDIKSALKKIRLRGKDRISLIVPRKYLAFHKVRALGAVFTNIYKKRSIFAGWTKDTSFQSYRVAITDQGYQDKGVMLHELAHTFNQLKEFYFSPADPKTDKPDRSSFCHNFIGGGKKETELKDNNKPYVGLNHSYPYGPYELIPCPSLEVRGLYKDQQNDWMALNQKGTIMNNQPDLFDGNGNYQRWISRETYQKVFATLYPRKGSNILGHGDPILKNKPFQSQLRNPANAQCKQLLFSSIYGNQKATGKETGTLVDTSIELNSKALTNSKSIDKSKVPFGEVAPNTIKVQIKKDFKSQPEQEILFNNTSSIEFFYEGGRIKNEISNISPLVVSEVLCDVAANYIVSVIETLDNGKSHHLINPISFNIKDKSVEDKPTKLPIVASQFYNINRFKNIQAIQNYLQQSINRNVNPYAIPVLDKYGNTLLHQSIIYNRPDLINKLLKKNNNWIGQKNKFNETPLDIARQTNNQEIIKLLESFSKQKRIYKPVAPR